MVFLALFSRNLQKFCKPFHAVSGQLTSIGELKDFRGAIGDALRISFAEITFRGNPFHRVKSDRSHRAHVDAHGAPDADVSFHFHHSICVGSMERSRGADVHAGRIFAIQARHRNIFPFPQGDDFNPSAPGVAHLVMMKSTDQLARATTTADILRIASIFKVTNSLFSHLILQTQNITD